MYFSLLARGSDQNKISHISERLFFLSKIDCRLLFLKLKLHRLWASNLEYYDGHLKILKVSHSCCWFSIYSPIKWFWVKDELNHEIFNRFFLVVFLPAQWKEILTINLPWSCIQNSQCKDLGGTAGHDKIANSLFILLIIGHDRNNKKCNTCQHFLIFMPWLVCIWFQLVLHPNPLISIGQVDWSAPPPPPNNSLYLLLVYVAIPWLLDALSPRVQPNVYSTVY
mgnify:CR=1 FL=1